MELIAFIDVETTGLDPYNDEILEVACVVTTDFGEVIAPRYYRRAKMTLPTMDRLFQNSDAHLMHIKSGLLEELVQDQLGGHDSNRAVADPIQDLRSYLFEHAEGAYLGGFSCHFDRRFLEAHRSSCLDALSHRHVDVTSISAIVEAATGQNLKEEIGEVEHRALADCRAAIEVYKKAYEVLKS